MSDISEQGHLEDQGFAEQARQEPEPVVAPAREELAALELKLFGPDPTRINGEIEKGHGSLYKRLHPDERAHLDGLELLVKAEDHLATAQAAVAKAEAHLEAEQAKVEALRAVAEQHREKIDGAAAE